MRKWCDKNATPQNHSEAEEPGKERTDYFHATQNKGLLPQRMRPLLVVIHWSPLEMIRMSEVTIPPHMKHGAELCAMCHHGCITLRLIM